MFNRAGVEINAHRVALRIHAHPLRQGVDRTVSQLHSQQAIALRVIAKNRRKRRGDNCSKPALLERPDGMLPRRPTAKVFTREQNRRVAIGRLIEHKVWVLAARIGITVSPGSKQPGGQPRSRHGAHFPRGNDGIGVNVTAPQRHGDAGMLRERGHSEVSATR